MIMDKLQSAMDRFKEQHRAAPAPPGSDRSAAPAPGVMYSRTRSVAIDEDILQRHRILTGHHSPFADAYKIHRTQVLHRLQENGWNMLGVTSPRDGEGKTLLATIYRFRRLHNCKINGIRAVSSIV